MAAPDTVVVVGAGVSGLTAALALRQAGHAVRVVTADDPSRTTSAIAAGVWFPTEVGPPDEVLRWGQRTLEVLTSIAASDPGSGVVLRDTLSLYRDDPGEPWWTAAIADVRRVPAPELPSGYAHGLRYRVPLADTPRYLPWLMRQLTARGVELEVRRLERLDDLAGEARVIVNCTGLAAGRLVDDDTMTPIRGQVVRTTNPGLERSLRDEHHPGGYTYIHPRSADCILGGTVEPGVAELAPDPQVGAAILERCRRLAPELERAEVLEHRVGLRPGRPAVRLEADEELVPGTLVIHDYGHGGAGVTLSWGCAEDVVALLGGRSPEGPG